MSNHLAVATVTACLRKLIQETIGRDLADIDAKVTTQRPDTDQHSGASTAAVNVYLHQVTPNPNWRNSTLPSRRNDGTLREQSAVAFDLHYLVSFYGDEQKLEPQRLLGSVTRALNERPVLSPKAIKDTITNQAFAYLSKSNLADALDLVRFTPESLSLEEQSKLWSVFFQTKHALSVCYVASTVLIETDEKPIESIPVKVVSIRTQATGR